MRSTAMGHTGVADGSESGTRSLNPAIAPWGNEVVSLNVFSREVLRNIRNDARYSGVDLGMAAYHWRDGRWYSLGAFAQTFGFGHEWIENDHQQDAIKFGVGAGVATSRSFLSFGVARTGVEIIDISKTATDPVVARADSDEGANYDVGVLAGRRYGRSRGYRTTLSLGVVRSGLGKKLVPAAVGPDDQTTVGTRVRLASPVRGFLLRRKAPMVVVLGNVESVLADGRSAEWRLGGEIGVLDTLFLRGGLHEWQGEFLPDEWRSSWGFGVVLAIEATLVRLEWASVEIDDGAADHGVSLRIGVPNGGKRRY